MAIIDTTHLGKTVNLTLHASQLLGGNFEAVKVKGILDFDDASNYGDMAALHAQVISSLPDNTINDPRQYSYIKVTTQSGENRVFGTPWISDIKIIESVKLQVILEDLDSSDVERIRRLLSANRFNKAAYRIID